MAPELSSAGHALRVLSGELHGHASPRLRAHPPPAFMRWALVRIAVRVEPPEGIPLDTAKLFGAHFHQHPRQSLSLAFAQRLPEQLIASLVDSFLGHSASRSRTVASEVSFQACS